MVKRHGRRELWAGLGAVLCGWIVGLNWAAGDGGSQPATTSGLRVLVLGDGNSDPGSGGKRRMWPEMLAEKTPQWRVVNRSKGGRSVFAEGSEAGLREAVVRLLDREACDVLVLSVGLTETQERRYGADGAQRVREGMDAVLATVRSHPSAKGVAVVVCTPLPVFEGKLPFHFRQPGAQYEGAEKRIKEITAAFGEAAKVYKATLVDVHEPLLGMEADFDDGVHAGDKAEARMAEVMRDGIERALKERPTAAEVATMAVTRPATRPSGGPATTRGAATRR